MRRSPASRAPRRCRSATTSPSALLAAAAATLAAAGGTYPRIAVIHHLQQPFLGYAAAPLGPVIEHFGSLPSLDDVDAIVSLGGEQAAWDAALDPEVDLI